VPPDQTTLEDFAYAIPRIVDLAAAGPSKAIRNVEHLRMSW